MPRDPQNFGPRRQNFSLRQALGSTSFLLILAAALVCCSLLGRVAVRTRVVRLGYEVSALQSENERLGSEAQALKTELLSRRAPDHLLKDGRTRFKLDYARPEQIVTVRGAP